MHAHTHTGPLPVMVYDWLDVSIREIADNIWHAQMAGWPRVLTYVYRPKREKQAIRRESLRLVPRIQSRDEYPSPALWKTREACGSAMLLSRSRTPSEI